MKKLLLGLLSIGVLGSVVVSCNDDNKDELYTPTPPPDAISPGEEDPYLELSATAINFDARDLNNPQTIEIDTNVGGGYIYWLEDEDDAQWVSFKKSRLSFDISVSEVNTSETDFRSAKVIVQVVSGVVGAIEKEIIVTQNPVGYYGPYYLIPENAVYEYNVTWEQSTLDINFITNMPAFIDGLEFEGEEQKPFEALNFKTETKLGGWQTVANHVTALAFNYGDTEEIDQIIRLIINPSPSSDEACITTVKISTPQLDPGLFPSEIVIKINQEKHPPVIYEMGTLSAPAFVSYVSLNTGREHYYQTGLTELRSGSTVNRISLSNDDYEFFGMDTAPFGVYRGEDQYYIRTGYYTQIEIGYPSIAYALHQQIILVNEDGTYENAPDGFEITLQSTIPFDYWNEGLASRYIMSSYGTYYLYGRDIGGLYEFIPSIPTDKKLGLYITVDDKERFPNGAGIFQLNYMDVSNYSQGRHTTQEERDRKGAIQLRVATEEDLETYPKRN